MRHQPQHSLAPDIFNLASNLLGSNRYDVAKVSEKETIATSVDTAVEKIKGNEGNLWVYPAINTEAYAKTMGNYRKYIALKNLAVAEDNEAIKEWNCNVRKFKEQNLQAHKRQNIVTPAQLEYSKLFSKLNKDLITTEYNTKVDLETIQHGMIFEKKKLATIKPITEHIFSAILFIYNQQLEKKNNRLISINYNQKSPLEPLKLNSWKVTQLKRDGLNTVNFTSKTIRNHRDRLLEFGVFQEKHFSGSYRGVEIVINPEILVIKELFFNKTAVIDNQLVTRDKCKFLPDNNVILTRTFIKEKEKKQNMERPSGYPSNLFFTGTPHSKPENKNWGGAADENNPSEAYEPTLSNKLQNLVLNPQDLIERLTRKEYNGYKPIGISTLYAEATNGTMTNDEFHDLFLQEFLKELQGKIYQKSNVYQGNWAKCYYLVKKQYCINFAGNAFNKTILVDKLVEIRWSINWAKGWFNKNQKINPLFPADYLDITRKTKNEIGFKYAMLKYNQQAENHRKYEVTKRQQVKNADTRKINANHSKKVNTEINRFLNNKITMDQLFNYVEKNLPKHFYEQLPNLIEKQELKLASQKFNIIFKI